MTKLISITDLDGRERTFRADQFLEARDTSGGFSLVLLSDGSFMSARNAAEVKLLVEEARSGR